MPIENFEVAIGTTEDWHPVVVVPTDESRTYRNLRSDGREYRYWRVSVVEDGVTSAVEGRLLLAGSTHSTPGQAIVLPRGEHKTWTRVQTGDEDIISGAGTLTVT